jgi:hypothetical protein
LLIKDGEALEKIQDIALLTQRIQANQDAYSRMAKNPEAAAVQLEAQREQSADTAYRLINQRNAETITDFINQFDEGMKGHDDISQDTKNEFVLRTLRKIHPALLDIIEEDRLLPQYEQQARDAKEWGKVVADIDAVINNSEESQEWKNNISKSISNVVENASNKDVIMANLEKVIDDNKETYFYIMTLEPEETRNNYTACYIYLWGDSEEAAKAIVAGLTETDKYYDYIIDLDLEVSKKTINFSDDSLVYCYYFAIEIE